MLMSGKYTQFDFNKFSMKNTHGDYSINQIICQNKKINAVIDFTSACIHPIAWEVVRSYSLADSEGADGSIRVDKLKKYIQMYLKNEELNNYDLENMIYIFFYQSILSDYFSEYYRSKFKNRKILLSNAIHTYNQCIWLDKNIEKINLK